MAKKKEPTLEDQIINFKGVMSRTSLSDYYYVGNTIISKNKQNHTILVNVSNLLWNELLKDKDNFPIKELNIINEKERELSNLHKYSTLSDNDWIHIGEDIQLYKGDSKELIINGSEYSIIISKEMLPLKLRKIECSNVYYHVYNNPTIVGIKILFQSTIEGFDFSIIRLFKFI